jgi:LPXTG-motif cell wall-anchored protein
VHIHSKIYFWDHLRISVNDFFKTNYQIAMWLFIFIGLQGLLLVSIFYAYLKKRKA